MIVVAVLVALIAGLVIGYVIGYLVRATHDRPMMHLAAAYKEQNDVMTERLTELEMALQDGE